MRAPDSTYVEVREQPEGLVLLHYVRDWTQHSGMAVYVYLLGYLMALC